MTVQIFFSLLFTTLVGVAYVAVNLYVGWFIFGRAASRRRRRPDGAGGDLAPADRSAMDGYHRPR